MQLAAEGYECVFRDSPRMLRKLLAVPVTTMFLSVLLLKLNEIQVENMAVLAS